MSDEGLKIPITADTEPFQKGLGNVENATNKAMDKVNGSISKTFESIGGKMTNIGKGLMTKVSIPVFAIGGLATKMASDLNQTELKVKQIFGDMADSVSSWASESERALGMGSGTIMGLTNSFGDLTQGIGMAKDASVEMSKSATILATQLGNWNNVSAGEAMEDIKRATMGSVRAVEKYGVKLNETVLSETARSMGLKKQFKDLSEVQKAEVRYQAIINGSTNAIEYWNEGNRSLNFTLTEVKEQIGNVMENIGKVLLPTVSNITKKIADLSAKLAKWTSENPKLTESIVKIVGAIAAVAPALLILGKVFTIFSKIGGVLSALLSPVGLVIAGFGLLGVAIHKNFLGLGDKFKKVVNVIKGVFEKVKNAIADAKEASKNGLDWTGVIATFISSFTGADINSVKKIFDTLKNVINTCKEAFIKAFEVMKTGADIAFNGIKFAYDTLLKPALDLIMTLVGHVKDWFVENWSKIGEVVFKTISTMKSVFNNILLPAFTVVGGAIVILARGIIEVLDFLSPAIKIFLDSVINSINLALNIIKFASDAIGAVINFVVSVFKTGWNLMQNIAQTVANVIAGVIQAFCGLVQGDFRSMKDGVVRIFSSLWSGVKNAINIMLNGINKAFGGLPAKMLQWGKDAISGFINGIKSMVSSVINTVKNIGNKIAGTFKKVLKINSPSRLFKQFGIWTGEGYSEGIEGSYKGIQKSMDGMSKIATGFNVEAITGNLDSLKERALNMDGLQIGLNSRLNTEKVQRYKEFNIGAKKTEAVIENNITLNGKVLTKELSPKFNVENGSKIKLDSRRQGVQ